MDLQHQSRAVYFAGCTASYVEEDIGMASVPTPGLPPGVDFSYLGKKENCCGTPMLVAGKWDTFEETLRKKYRSGQSQWRRYGHFLLPGLRYDVAACLPAMG